MNWDQEYIQVEELERERGEEREGKRRERGGRRAGERECGERGNKKETVIIYCHNTTVSSHTS